MLDPETCQVLTGRKERMTANRIAKLIGNDELRDGREEEVRRFVFVLSRLMYEQGRLDALDEIYTLVGLTNRHWSMTSSRAPCRRRATRLAEPHRCADAASAS
jgi:hypothetical protein